MANKRCRRETGIIRVYKRFSAELVPFERIEVLVRAVIHRDEIPVIITHNGILEIFPLPIRNLTTIGIPLLHFGIDNWLRIAYTFLRVRLIHALGVHLLGLFEVIQKFSFTLFFCYSVL